jgi:hypothetical protein
MVHPRLRCILTNDPTKDTPTTETTLWFEQEEGKTSSFLLRVPSDLRLAKPAHVLVHCVTVAAANRDNGNHNQIHPFLFGGLEILSNARNVEAYTKDESNPVEENYLLTARGIKEDGDTELHRSVLVCPKGPETVARLHLKLLSLRPANCTNVSMVSIKLKGRLPNVELMNATSDATATTTTTPPILPPPPPPPFHGKAADNATNSNGYTEPGMSIGDMKAAMAGMTMLVGSTATKISKGVQEGLMELDRTVSQRMQHLEHGLGAVLQSHKVALEQQNSLIQQQQELILNQARALGNLQEQQTLLLGMISAMRDDMKEQTAALLLEKERRETAVVSMVQQHVKEEAATAFAVVSGEPLEQSELHDEETELVAVIDDGGKQHEEEEEQTPKLWIPDPDENAPPKLWIPEPADEPANGDTLLTHDPYQEHEPVVEKQTDHDADLLNLADCSLLER